ncbi:NUDIX hydrolase [Streptomyces sp. NPDC058773]|uniref:NUDIX hydrolase n=1 Tax=Streptomyces sp. NPDC058773 TaxID=3346632 RepID=UPI0036799FF5
MTTRALSRRSSPEVTVAKKYAYAVLHDGKGRFLLATKNERAFFFNSAKGGDVYPKGIDLTKEKCGGKRALPGGERKAKEKPEAGALREFQEETGVSLASCTAVGKEWTGQQYSAGYFGTSPANFDQLVKNVRDRLARGHQAAKDIADGVIKTGSSAWGMWCWRQGCLPERCSGTWTHSG